MSAPHRSLADLPHRFRAQLIELRLGFRRVRSDLRADPGMLWRNPAARLFGWIALGVAVLLGTHAVIGHYVGAGSRSAEQPTLMATLYVACTNPACRATGTIERPRDFSAWPVRCDKCGQMSAYRATETCPKCGRRYATAPGQPAGCPFCAEASQPATQTRTTPRSTDPNNLEDGW